MHSCKHLQYREFAPCKGALEVATTGVIRPSCVGCPPTITLSCNHGRDLLGFSRRVSTGMGSRKDPTLLYAFSLENQLRPGSLMSKGRLSNAAWVGRHAVVLEFPAWSRPARPFAQGNPFLLHPTIPPSVDT